MVLECFYTRRGEMIDANANANAAASVSMPVPSYCCWMFSTV
jgi:hypothetical protein